ncbi:nucleotide exchange factor GrpE [Arsenicicoccus dermatophilus]|uniref:nucleotide exchange factor GrpE n=1 Tax=Arsenicicoccus dermatophilus TaxID=1076331 RepID=UPI0030C6F2ED
MTEGATDRVGSSEQGEPTGPVIRDKRRLDPQTGRVREQGAAVDPGLAHDDREVPMSDQHHEHDDQHTAMAMGDDSFGGAVGDALPGRQSSEGEAGAVEEAGQDDEDGMPKSPFSPEETAAQTAALDAERARAQATSGQGHPDTALAAERLADLQRLQAEYVNYKKRVDRDKATLKDLGVASVVEALMPVLDEIALARQHGDLAEGSPFASIADKLQAALGRFGLEQFGEAGEAFDPTVHEALMHVQAELPEGATGTTVVQVLQPGYRQGERVLRAARVSVADPQ